MRSKMQQTSHQGVHSTDFALRPVVSEPLPSAKYEGNHHLNESNDKRNTWAAPPAPNPQTTQNKADEDARRQATKDLTQSWMDRLQLISVIVNDVLCFYGSRDAAGDDTRWWRYCNLCFKSSRECGFYGCSGVTYLGRGERRTEGS
ncbi:hypothetical protein C8R43DRAFT_116660 [Mycena crocata]|nr:hypothetical protein C8R43DRAFT_116660 [Mycena crocata]